MTRLAVGESKLHARRRRRHLVLAGIVSILVLTLIGALAALTWAPFMRITDVSVSGVRDGEVTAMRQTVWKEISGGYLHLFAKNNIFLYPRGTVVAALQNNFSAIKSVEVHALNFNGIAVEVVERQPTALWCGDSPEFPSACYFLDPNGVAYAPAADYSGDAYKKYYGALTKGGTGGGAKGHYLADGRFAALPALVETLQKTANIGAVASIYVDQGGDVHLTFGDGFVLLFGVADDGGSVVERFALALGAKPFVNRHLSDFQYLDLRFGDKIYYK